MLVAMSWDGGRGDWRDAGQWVQINKFGGFNV